MLSRDGVVVNRRVTMIRVGPWIRVCTAGGWKQVLEL